MSTLTLITSGLANSLSPLTNVRSSDSVIKNNVVCVDIIALIECDEESLVYNRLTTKFHDYNWQQQIKLTSVRQEMAEQKAKYESIQEQCVNALSDVTLSKSEYAKIKAQCAIEIRDIGLSYKDTITLVDKLRSLDNSNAYLSKFRTITTVNSLDDLRCRILQENANAIKHDLQHFPIFAVYDTDPLVSDTNIPEIISVLSSDYFPVVYTDVAQDLSDDSLLRSILLDFEKSIKAVRLGHRPVGCFADEFFPEPKPSGRKAVATKSTKRK